MIDISFDDGLHTEDLANLSSHGFVYPIRKQFLLLKNLPNLLPRHQPDLWKPLVKVFRKGTRRLAFQVTLKGQDGNFFVFEELFSD